MWTSNTDKLHFGERLKKNEIPGLSQTGGAFAERAGFCNQSLQVQPHATVSTVKGSALQPAGLPTQNMTLVVSLNLEISSALLISKKKIYCQSHYLYSHTFQINIPLLTIIFKNPI